MGVYVIATIDISDVERYDAYRAAAYPTFDQYGARRLAASSDVVVLEGDEPAQRMFVLEFDDLEAARRWYDSSEYRAACALREGAADLRIVAVPGFSVAE